MLNEKLEHVTPEDYLRQEVQSPLRHEYVAGGIYAMTGASLRRNVIALNLATALRTHLKTSPCRVFMEGVKLHVVRDNAYYYPDVMVSCDPRLQQLGANDMVIEQPVVLIEVLSESTAGIDRREKLNAYRKLASLKEYVLVAQEMRSVEVYRRSGDVGWERILLDAADTLELTSLEFRLALAEIYDGAGI